MGSTLQDGRWTGSFQRRMAYLRSQETGELHTGPLRQTPGASCHPVPFVPMNSTQGASGGTALLFESQKPDVLCTHVLLQLSAHTRGVGHVTAPVQQQEKMFRRWPLFFFLKSESESLFLF